MFRPNMFQRPTLAHPNQILHEDPPFPWAAWRPSNPRPSSTTAPQPSWANAPTSSTTAWTVSDLVVCARCSSVLPTRHSYSSCHVSFTCLKLSHSYLHQPPYRKTHTHTRYFNLWMAFKVVMVTDQQWLTWIISPVRDQTPKTQTKGTVAVDSKGRASRARGMDVRNTYVCSPVTLCFITLLSLWRDWRETNVQRLYKFLMSLAPFCPKQQILFLHPILIFPIAFTFEVFMHLLLVLVLRDCDKWLVSISPTSNPVFVMCAACVM